MRRGDNDAMRRGRREARRNYEARTTRDEGGWWWGGGGLVIFNRAPALAVPCCVFREATACSGLPGMRIRAQYQQMG
jgi:hypothetical protein